MWKVVDKHDGHTVQTFDTQIDAVMAAQRYNAGWSVWPFIVVPLPPDEPPRADHIKGKGNG